jgi:hypothetical protein
MGLLVLAVLMAGAAAGCGSSGQDGSALTGRTAPPRRGLLWPPLW